MSRILCIGHAVQDFVLHVDEFPARPEKYPAHHFESVGGGPAATAAVAVARLGGTALLAARVGADTIGREIVAELESFGVDCSNIRAIGGRGSSLSCVLVDAKGERLIVNYLDPELDGDTDWLPPVESLNVDAVLADSRWPEGGLWALNAAREAGIPGILDADLPTPPDQALLRAASHVAFSADCLREMSAMSDLADSLRSVSDGLAGWSCVTDGDSGTLHLHEGQAIHSGAFKVTVADTVGAGDVWHGAFTLALAERKSILDAIDFAGAAAAAKVRNGGGRNGAPTLREVRELIESASTSQGQAKEKR